MVDTKIKLSIDGVQSVVGSLGQVEGKLQDVAGSVSTLSAIGGALSFGTFAAMIKSSIDAADELSDLGAKTSLTVEQLTGLNWAAQMAGTDLDTVARAVNKLAAEMGKDAEKFAQIGVDAKDPIEALKQLSDVFVSIENPQARAAFGNAALGKSWEDLAPLLSEGGAKIGDLVQRGQELSGVTGEMSGQAGEFNDRLDEMRAAVSGLVNRAAADLLPLLNVISEEMLDASLKTHGLTSSFNPLTETLRALIVLGGNVSFVLKGVGTEIGGIAAQIAALATGDFKGFAAIGEMMRSDAAAARAEFDRWEARVMGAGLDSSSVLGVGEEIGKNRQGGVPPKVANFIGGDDTAKKAADAAKKERDERLKVLEEVNGFSNTFAADWARRTAMYESGQITLEQMIDSQNKLLARQPAVKEANDTLEKIKKAEEAATNARNKRLETLSAGLTTLGADVLAQQEYIDRLGLSAEAIAELDAAKLEATAADKERLAILQMESDFTGVETHLLRQQADELRKLAGLKREGAAVGAIVEQQRQEAEEAKKIWENFTENIQRNLGDTLYNGLQGNFDSIGDAFLAMTQRMVSDAIAADLTGALLGKGGGNTSALFSALGNGFMSLFGGSQPMGADWSNADAGSDWSRGVASANGNAFDAGRLTAFATGGAFTNGIVNRPTAFNVGLMGEAGPEAIMPLTRDSQGRLGVRAQGDNGGAVVVKVNITNNNPQAQVSTQQSADGSSIEVLVDVLDSAMADRIGSGIGATHAAMASRFGLRTAV